MVNRLNASMERQLQRCQLAVKVLSGCLSAQNWHQAADRNGRVKREMELLRMSFMGHQALDEHIASQIRDLQTRLWQLQHQLAMHVNTAEIEVSHLASGFRASTDRSMSLS